MTAHAAAPARSAAITVEAISKRYGRILALDAVSLEVATGDMFALLGPNGAGKTTLLHILCTILRPDSGVATLAGYDVVRQPLRARQNIGVVFQEPSLDDRLTVFENLNFHGLAYRMPRALRRRRIDEMLELVELADWREHLVRSLSSGMKRRLEIARALLHDPRILFLDEPTVGLDAQSRERIWSYLGELRQQRELTVVVTTHYIEEVEYCDDVCIIDHGKVLTSGSPDSLKQAHGQSLIRVRPRDEETGEAIRRAFPGTLDGAGGAIIVPAVDADVTDRFLADFGNRVREIAFDRPSLESVFLSLTGRDLRDEVAGVRERTYAFGRRGGELTR